MKSAINTLAKAGGVLCAVASSPALWAQGQQMPTNTAGGYNYPAPAYGQQYQQPNYPQAQSAAQPGYAYPQATQQQGYAYGQSAQQPNYGYGQATQQPSYAYGQAAQQPAYGYGEATQPAYQYQYGQSTRQPTYGYGQSYYGYGQQYSRQNYAYQPSYRQPGYSYQQPYYGSGYTASPYSYYNYSQRGYTYSPMMRYPGYGSGSTGPLANAPWDNLNGPDIFGSNSPFEDPLQHEGHWAKKGFHPWRSGPFAHDKWSDHPATNMPWGNFPGWGDGFFGGFGPDQWEGVTPWGNDVPFKWFDPTDPEESIAEIWEDALNTPNKMGRLPPGFTAPYISVPNPIDVENEFERNAQIAPDEIHNMWGDGADFGGDADKEKSDKDKDKAKDKDGKQAGEKPAQEETQAAARDRPRD